MAKKAKSSHKTAHTVTLKRTIRGRSKAVKMKKRSNGNGQVRQFILPEALAYEVIESATYEDPILFTEDELQKFGT